MIVPWQTAPGERCAHRDAYAERAKAPAIDLDRVLLDVLGQGLRGWIVGVFLRALDASRSLVPAEGQEFSVAKVVCPRCPPELSVLITRSEAAWDTGLGADGKATPKPCSP